MLYRYGNPRNYEQGGEADQRLVLPAQCALAAERTASCACWSSTTAGPDGWWPIGHRRGALRPSSATRICAQNCAEASGRAQRLSFTATRIGCRSVHLGCTSALQTGIALIRLGPTASCVRDQRRGPCGVGLSQRAGRRDRAQQAGRQGPAAQHSSAPPRRPPRSPALRGGCFVSGAASRARSSVNELTRLHAAAAAFAERSAWARSGGSTVDQ